MSMRAVPASQCLYHTACPKCRIRGRDNKGNNLGVFDDGHRWCFSCGYRESAQGKSVTQIAEKVTEQKADEPQVLRLPSDYTPCLPRVALDWLDRYGITHKEILANKFGWSQQYERLICPIYDNGQLIFYQGRSFTDERKAINFGSPENTFSLIGGGLDSLSVVLVEDLISAIRVGRHECAMPIWGSNISDARLVKLSKMADKLFIWLDHDKATYSIARRIKASIIFEEARSILTLKDPKDYSDFEIRNLLKLPEVK